MNKLTIENFGPITKAVIDVKDMMVFIGPQASGKSTLAKIITILNDFNFRQHDNIKFNDELKKYNIHSYLKKSTKIDYRSHFFTFIYNAKEEVKIDYENFYNLISERGKPKEKFKLLKGLINMMLVGIKLDEKGQVLFRELIRDPNYGPKKNLNSLFNVEPSNVIDNLFKIYGKDPSTEELHNIFKPINNVFPFITPLDSMYVPAERTILPLISSNIAGLIHNKINIPNHIIQVAQEFEKAVQKIREIKLGIIGDLKYKNVDGQSFIYHNRNQKISMEQSSSGVQSILPIMLLIEHSLKNENYINLNYVVEEPELNLYPEAQYKLTQYLVKNCLETKNELRSKNLIITTHSPYILTSINNLLLSYHKGQINKKATTSIISEDAWINPKNFNAYQVKNGTVKRIYNSKSKLIEDTIIDDVSDILMHDFKTLASIND